MTEKEAQLRKERDDLYNKYLLKDKELHEYRNKQESGALEELNKQYKGKIIQVRLWDRGLSPLNKREREGDYEIVFVEEVVHEYDSEIEIKGRNLSEGVPRPFSIHSNEVLEALSEPLNQVVGAVRLALEKTPPELSADIVERGIVLTGGGARLEGFEELIEDRTGINAMTAENPECAVAEGCGLYTEKIEQLSRMER